MFVFVNPQRVSDATVVASFAESDAVAEESGIIGADDVYESWWH